VRGEDQEKMAKRRFELSASGLDEATIGVSSDPWTSGQNTGLRIPKVLPGDTPLNRPRYLFLLATRTILNPCKLIGIRQGLTIGNFLEEDAPNLRPVEFFVTTPNFKFSDGNVSWHLVYEDNVLPNPHELTITDAQNWSKDCADGPAMLYNTFTNTVTNVNGAPIFYMQNLTAYTPPQFQNQWRPVADDLKNFYDLRFPYQSDNAWRAFGKGIELEVGRRISLYASVLQTNSDTRQDDLPSPAVLGYPPEEAFISFMSTNGGGGEEPTLGAIYWRVMGGLVFEDEIADVGGRG
jgi:hypothetical protein